MGLLGLHTLGVKSVGQIPRVTFIFLAGLLPRRSTLARRRGIALMSFTETIAAGRAFAKTEEPPIRPNQELLATGLANAAVRCSGHATGGGTTQTAVNRLAGHAASWRKWSPPQPRW